MSPRKAKPARECAAQIVNGRVACDCLKDKPEIRADIAVCYPKMTALMEQTNA